MFTWICPQCGREVPPSYTECPDCAAKAAQTGAAVPGQQPEVPVAAAAVPPAPPYAAAPAPLSYAATPPPPPAGPPVYEPLPGYVLPAGPPSSAYQQPAQPQPYPPPQAYAPRRSGLPTWLMAVLFALAFVGLGAGIYWIVGGFKGRTPTAPAATVESPAAKVGAKTNPLQRYIEVAGVRFLEDPKKKGVVLARFILINHSDADLTGLAGNVTVWGRTQKSEEDAEGTFSFNTDIGANVSKELTVPLETKRKIYELPDWQNVATDVQITAPQ
jgi:hypothetical protein